MPRIRRRFLLDPAEIGVYHCINRCVRRAFLCGNDPVSGKSYEHRRQWIQDRMQFLAGQLGVDVLGFAVLHNHLHIVLRNRPDVVQGWSDLEVARRWWNVFPKRKDDDGNAKEPSDIELQMIVINPEKLAEIRQRLSSVSWFMRCLAERIARMSNAEDMCAGRFWQGRFCCVPLLDESALAACLAYVDLNPVRAQIAETPETSRFTSVYERIRALRAQLADAPVPAEPKRPDPGSDESQHCDAPLPAELDEKPANATWLSPFELSDVAQTEPVPADRASNKGCLPMSFAEYLNLLDWTGRQIRADKRGAIPADLAPILERLRVDSDGWLKLMGRFSRLFRRAAGRPQSMQIEREVRGCRLMQGIRHSRAIFL